MSRFVDSVEIDSANLVSGHPIHSSLLDGIMLLSTLVIVEDCTALDPKLDVTVVNGTILVRDG